MSDLPNSPGGYFTNGMVTPTGADLSANSRIPVDTGLPSGQSPQAGGIIPGTLPAPATQIGLTAAADGAKADATPLGYGVNTVTTVAGAADSVLAPYAYPGAVCVIDNDGANALQVFGKGADTIDGVATGTGNALTNANRGILFGVAGSGDGSDAGAWVSLKGAKIS
jgi:hypothetical protein